MADIVSKVKIGTSYAIRSGYTYGIGTITSSTTGTKYTYFGTVLDNDGNTISLGSLYEGLTIYVRFHEAPTFDNVNLKLHGFGAKKIRYGDGSVSPKDKITPGALYALRYTVVDGTGYFYMVHSAEGNGGGSSTDENLKVSTYTTNNVLKPIVLHNGGGTTGNGYTTDTLQYRNFNDTDVTGSPIYAELAIGHISTITPANNADRRPGQIYISNDKANDGYSAGNILRSHSENALIENSLPSVSGSLLSANMCINSQSQQYVVGSMGTTVPYYQCLYKGDCLYAPSVDEKINPTQYGTDNPGTYEPKRIVLHDGGDSSSAGYVAANLTYSQSHSNYGSYDVLTIGKVKYNYNPDIHETIGGMIYLSNALGSTNETFGNTLVPQNGGSLIKNTLPNKNGALLSSGACATPANVSISTTDGVRESTQYYQCLYSNGNLYSPAIGSGSDYHITSGMWVVNQRPTQFVGTDLIGTDGKRGPRFDIIVRENDTISTLNMGTIPFATRRQPGVVTTGWQEFGGFKHFSDGIFIGHIDPDNTSRQSCLRVWEDSVIISTGVLQIHSGEVYFGSNLDPNQKLVITPETNGRVAVVSTSTTNNYEKDSLAVFGTDGALRKLKMSTNDADNTYYLSKTGEWLQPYGQLPVHYEGKNVFGTNASSTTNGTVQSGTVYLNHVENSVAISSLSIIGSGNVSVSASNGKLTIFGADGTGDDEVSYTTIDSDTMGVFCGQLDKGKNIVVPPARIDMMNSKDYGYTRQGVVKPYFESKNSIPEYHDTLGAVQNNKNYYLNEMVGYEQFAKGGSQYVTGINLEENKFIAIPIIVDFAYNQYTRRYESIPYILFPKEIVSDDWSKYYELKDEINNENQDEISTQISDNTYHPSANGSVASTSVQTYDGRDFYPDDN